MRKRRSTPKAAVTGTAISMPSAVPKVAMFSVSHKGFRMLAVYDQRGGHMRDTISQPAAGASATKIQIVLSLTSFQQIAKSKAYQRSSQVPKGLQDPKPEEYLVGAIRPLSEEQFAYAILQASGFTDAERMILGAKVGICITFL